MTAPLASRETRWIIEDNDDDPTQGRIGSEPHEVVWVCLRYPGNVSRRLFVPRSLVPNLAEIWDSLSPQGLLRLREQLSQRLTRKSLAILLSVLDADEPICRHCLNEHGERSISGQIAGLISEIICKGLCLVSVNCHCPDCGRSQGFLSFVPIDLYREHHDRIGLSAGDKDIIHEVLGERNALLGRRGGGRLIVDHRIPVNVRPDPDNTTELVRSRDEEFIRSHYQLLTPSDNDVKRDHCNRCLSQRLRGCPYGGEDQEYFYHGDRHWPDGLEDPRSDPLVLCLGCGWYDPQALLRIPRPV